MNHHTHTHHPHHCSGHGGRHGRHGPPGGFGPPGERGRHRDGGRRRMFDAGELRLVLLLLLETQPRHGYDVIREIEERTGGAYAPSPGVIYPTLTLLEEIGQIAETQAEGPKRLYALTPAGLIQLNEHRAEAEAAMARLVALGAENQRMDSGPIWRAMQNLTTVLRQQGAGLQDKTRALDIAEALDEAARRIERL